MQHEILVRPKYYLFPVPKKMVKLSSGYFDLYNKKKIVDLPGAGSNERNISM